MKTKYKDIVFLQGDDAAEALDILDNAENPADIWDYLLQYEDDSNEIKDVPAYGTDDTIEEMDDLILSYNLSLGYVGLQRRVKGGLLCA